MNQLFTLEGMLRGSWEFDRPVYMCFVDLVKATTMSPCLDNQRELGAEVLLSLEKSQLRGNPGVDPELARGLIYLICNNLVPE